ncbi:MAG: DUF1800 domain-containing protein [Armatimonadota bacterium]
MVLTEQEKIAHLLRRFGFGASEAELTYYSKNGLAGAITALLDYEKVEDVCEVDPMSFSNGKNVVNLRVIQNLFSMRLIGTKRPLEEKMTLFWHNHFACSSAKVENGFVIYNHINTLRKYAMGRFNVLLEAISKDPGMIYYLDGQENVAEHPNENFAREVMELFTLGIGNYTEKDVQESARCYTGWTYGRGLRANDTSPKRIDTFKFFLNRHDQGIKTVLGETGNLNGEEMLLLLCKQKQTAKFITKKLWSWFAYEDPEDALIERLATKFYASNLDIKALVRSVMESPEFYSDKAFRKVIKNPVDFTVSTIRQLGAGQIMIERLKEGIANPQINEQNGLNLPLVRSLAPAQTAFSSSKSMGMELMAPPDVSGWRTGAYWITSATMVERMKWADKLFAGGPAGNTQNPANPLGGNRGPQVGIQAYPLFAEDPTPAGIVKSLMSVFDISLPPAKVAGLVTTAENEGGQRIDQRNANAVARAVCKLMFSTPEFQMM